MERRPQPRPDRHLHREVAGSARSGERFPGYTSRGARDLRGAASMSARLQLAQVRGQGPGKVAASGC